MPMDGNTGSCHRMYVYNWLGWSHGSSVDIATSYAFDSRFSASTVSRPTLQPAQLSIQWEPKALFPGVKRQGREDDHSLPSSAEVKNGKTISPLPIRLHGVVIN
jgi:hypothetical protein